MLRVNIFEYDGKLHSQETGIAIGAPFACACSGIVMAKIEEDGISNWRNRRGGGGGEVKGHDWKTLDPGEVDWWGRFRDDCIGLWRGTRLEFNRFVATMNEVDQAIKFTAAIDWDVNQVAFLDTVVSIDEEDYIQTGLYVKKNTKNVLLLPTSCHLPMVTRGTVFGLGLRIRRICSKEREAEEDFKNLEEKLLRREYDKTVVRAGIEKAKAVMQEEALQRAERKKRERGWRSEAEQVDCRI